MATRESRARCKNDPDLNLLLTNSTLEQPLCSGASRDSLGDEQSAHFGSCHVAPAFRSTFERHWFRRRHWLGGMAVVLDLAKDRGVDPGHGGRIHGGWWRFGASSDCSGRHHPRRWQLILNVVRELLLSKGQKHILLNLGNVNYCDIGVKESFVSESAPFTRS